MNAIHMHVLDHLTDKWEKKHMPYVEQKLSPQVTWEVLQGLHTPWISPKHVQACAWIFEPMHRPDHESRVLYIDKERLVGLKNPSFWDSPNCCTVLYCYCVTQIDLLHNLCLIVCMYTSIECVHGYVILICRINFALCTWSLSHALYLHPSPPLLQNCLCFVNVIILNPIPS